MALSFLDTPGRTFPSFNNFVHERTLIHRRLIVTCRRSRETDMFVITWVPSSNACGNIGKSLKTFHYLGGGDFTGRVFCFTPEGEFEKAFGYTDICQAVCWS